MWRLQLVLLLLVVHINAAPPLKQYNITGDLTISGISSGGFQVVQTHVIFSSIVKHAGVVAGGPFYCSRGTTPMIGLQHAELDCMEEPMLIPLSTLYEYTTKHSASGDIDPVSNLKGSMAFLWSGLSDTVVKQGVMKALNTYYEHFGVNTHTYFNFSAEHGWPTDFCCEACGTLGSPYIVDCHFDYAQEILSSFYPNGWNNTRGKAEEASLYTFDQKSLATGGSIGLAATGYIYVPDRCLVETCRLHVNFHGCEQQAGKLGTKYVMSTGLNEWAEANGIIIVYPQTKASEVPLNPKGCWDWWGFSGSDYCLKTGSQNKFFMNIIDTITGGGPAPSPPTEPTPPPPPSPPQPIPPPPTPSPPPTPTPPPPTPPQTCNGRIGDYCISAHEYIVCPAGLKQSCGAGTCTQTSHGICHCSL